jgi:hypothetical protein
VDNHDPAPPVGKRRTGSCRQHCGSQSGCRDSFLHIAFLGSYHAQFIFADKLTRQAAESRTPEDVAAWIDAHPRGVLVGKIACAPQNLAR